MTQPQKIVIFGGTGFLGRYIIQDLAQKDFEIIVVTRNLEKALPLKVFGDIGQITPIIGDVRDPHFLNAIVASADCVINLLGILYETRHQKFNEIHHLFPARLAELCHQHQVKSFIHISALGSNIHSPSHYSRTKALGEDAIRKHFKTATILKPSVVFGAEDQFLNLFAGLACKSPILPLIGGGKTKLQPVFVGDIASAVTTILCTPALQGETYELGGPEVISFKDLMIYLLKTIKKDRYLMPFPWMIASFEASILELFPKPLLTRDQVRLLKQDNIVSKGTKTFKALKIKPKSLELIAPTYLSQWCKDTA
ncbi:MAG: complex I NDUFA9 subunit family protein [Alphaproteobacteria bacterium]|jgi:uncharacterized protein YbjT (DUF2867 family)|nr:complex I NDUFA9 subunit family protein [Alphaproteobacteria bacterium]MBP9877458.1 complex I NDUFA9 subunit family protein [Alphaproteobacteria bacterium]